MKKPDKPPKAVPRRRKRPAPELRSDKLSAAFISHTLGQCQEDLGDLLTEFRYLQRYYELDDLAFILFKLDTIKTKCDRFVETGSWEAHT